MRGRGIKVDENVKIRFLPRENSFQLSLLNCKIVDIRIIFCVKMKEELKKKDKNMIKKNVVSSS